MSELREEIAKVLDSELLGCAYISERVSLRLADRILAIPRIAEALKAPERPVRKLNLGHSIGTGTRRD